MWRRAWRRAPRRLKVQRSGYLVVLLAVGLGVAAIATNHNGLFFAWGLALGAMVISGLVSELSLRRLSADAQLPQGLRVGAPARLSIGVDNHSRFFAAWALRLRGQFEWMGHGPQAFQLPFVMRLEARGRVGLGADWTPTRRGATTLSDVGVKTSYPFGFFIKARRLPLASQTFWVGPKRVPIKPPNEALWATLGDFVAQSAGQGDEFFALRAWRNGDDPRHIVWRRLARQKRAFVVEHQAHLAREVVIVAQLDPLCSEPILEHVIAVLGSLAEVLLRRGYGVGLISHGLRLGAFGSLKQRDVILDALARLDSAQPMSTPSSHRLPEIALTGQGLVTKSAGRLAIPWAEWAKSSTQEPS